MATNNSANIPTGLSGAILQGQGIGTAVAFSTATYPSTAGTTGNVLTSDGTNFVSSVPALFTVTGQLTSAQIKSLHATPIQIVAAQGSGTVIKLVSYFASFAYGGSNVFVAGASQTINLYYGTTTNVAAIITNATIVGTTNTVQYSQTFTIAATAKTSYDNLALTWYNPVVTEISGNAANNNVINYSVSYIVCTI